MNRKERAFITATLVAIILLVTVDLITDFSEGVRLWHLLVEGSIAAMALAGIIFLLCESFSLKRSLTKERHANTQLQAKAQRWRSQSKKFLDGLSCAIDDQLTTWSLTNSEKEVSFLLLKGLSLREIAATRGTAEKTARAQATSIYSKAGLTGRSELAAFFLEDLLLPSNNESEAGSRLESTPP